MPGLTATQSAEGKPSGLERLHVKAKQDRSLRFNNVLHHITLELLEKAYKSLNRKSARGVDHQSWKQYGEELPSRIRNLHQRGKGFKLGMMSLIPHPCEIDPSLCPQQCDPI
ncbi:MAG: hypothetical protein GY820_06425 [Gammaproteobacteria bacterium]|nr:hypothetical protein [Gammaproteobacteria bacterium]